MHNQDKINDDLMTKISEKLASINSKPVIKNVGTVLSVKDGIAILDGLSSAIMTEKIYCPVKNISALVLNLNQDTIGAAILGDFSKIAEGDIFECTGEVLSVRVSDALLGHTINGLGEVIDGTNISMEDGKQMPLEKIAPGVIERHPVETPMQTGILAIDATTPIGRGQRQLIIGDRSTGKTAIAIDSIINQKYSANPMICIYNPIGQKNAKVAAISEILKINGAMDYTIIVNASAADSAADQYLSPYTATAIAEYFLEKGKDVLVIYDDLTKHAWAYRQISLTLKRPAGREAYPGDIFYVHSRLLERSCRLNKENGNGSITSLPIIETQFGDVSAYIPTNVISITDGQIYVDTDIFNSNIRPAIDVRNSVSRVGGAAQIKEMKKVASKLRLEIATYKELEVFAQFGGSDLDEGTKTKIERGKKTVELLKQEQYTPYNIITQIAFLTALNENYINDIPVDQLDKFKTDFIEFFDNVKETSEVSEKVKEFFSTY